MDAEIAAALLRADAEMVKGSPYENVVAALDEVARMPGAEAVAYHIAQSRFSFSLAYKRPLAEVEVALRERLAVDDDPVSRARTAGAAYATHAALRPYFEAAAAELEAITPRTPVIERALASAARVREVAAENHGDDSPAR